MTCVALGILFPVISPSMSVKIPICPPLLACQEISGVPLTYASLVFLSKTDLGKQNYSSETIEVNLSHTCSHFQRLFLIFLVHFKAYLCIIASDNSIQVLNIF